MPLVYPPIQHTLDHLFRHESGKMIAVLCRLMGLSSLEVAQDIVQDSLLQAMNTWPYTGLPANPAGWLHRTARNKAIDYLRRQKKWQHISPQYAYLLQSEYTLAPTVDQLFQTGEIEDSTLRMLFACCHPAIPLEAQLALSLKTLCGLSTAEIARAFLCSEETVAKRIYRAREKMRSENISLELPPPARLLTRLDAVLHCLYLLFNEGYQSSQPDQLIREDLCHEAMRLAHSLTQNAGTALPRTFALLALFCFQASRLKARLDGEGAIILLPQQDRTQWYRPLVAQGFQYLEAAAAPFEVTPYHLQAGIASLHAAADSFESTDWAAIYTLYKALYQLEPFPVVALHKAVAAGYAVHPQEALKQLGSIHALDTYYLYHAAVGEMHLLLGKKEEAANHFSKALHRAPSNPERKLIRSKIAQCTGEAPF